MGLDCACKHAAIPSKMPLKNFAPSNREYTCIDNRQIFIHIKHRSTFVSTSLYCNQLIVPIGLGGLNTNLIIFKLILVNVAWCISREIALKWVPLNFSDDKSALVEVIAWWIVSMILACILPTDASSYTNIDIKCIKSPKWITKKLTAPILHMNDNFVSNRYLSITKWPPQGNRPALSSFASSQIAGSST